MRSLAAGKRIFLEVCIAQGELNGLRVERNDRDVESCLILVIAFPDSLPQVRSKLGYVCTIFLKTCRIMSLTSDFR